jgi:hypothetical protein
MFDLTGCKDDVRDNGFTIVENIFTPTEVVSLIAIINHADQSNKSFRKTNDLFAIRKFLKEIPAVQPVIFNEKLKFAIENLFGNEYFVVKSIYFDKPEKSNWFVAWHQDLTISIGKKTELPDWRNWTKKFDQFAVQPPVEILQSNFTIRIHLDDTNEFNGALKVIPGSHLKGVQRIDELDRQHKYETSCNVRAGGVMVMRPLLMHSSAPQKIIKDGLYIWNLVRQRYPGK